MRHFGATVVPVLVLAFVVVAFLMLAACTSKPTVYRPVTVNVPVAVPCALPRPTEPTPLAQTYPHWTTMDAKQKAAAVSKQALNWQTYAQQLHAATAACP